MLRPGPLKNLDMFEGNNFRKGYVQKKGVRSERGMFKEAASVFDFPKPCAKIECILAMAI
jgi:hypothetical protein